MVLIGFFGELGSGKTLGLTYFAWNNFFYLGRKIFSNYTLFGIPFTPVKTIGDFFKMIPPETTDEEILSGVEKFFAGDELWKWAESQTVGKGSVEKKKIVDDILGASRKSFVTIGYTTQRLKKIDPTIREITDIVIYPELSADKKSYLKLLPIPYGGSTVMEPIIIKPLPFFAMYNTYQKIPQLIMSNETSEEVYIPIEKNSALIKFFIDNKFTEKEAVNFIRYIERKFIFPRLSQIKEYKHLCDEDREIVLNLRS